MCTWQLKESKTRVKDADFYLENMPVAFCAVKVLTDEEGNPSDYLFTYSNKAHAVLEGRPHGQLVGKRYLELHEKIAPKFLLSFYESAYHGVEHVLNDYNAEKDRYFLIYIYPLEQGSCGCILEDVTESRGLERALQREAMYDPLVDLYNVKAGKERVSEELDKAKDNGVNIMFLMDLDDFKYINDTYGHLKGDEFLKRFAGILKNTFRKSDIIYRMGGDEFIGFISNVAKPEQAVKRIMERMYREFETLRGTDFALSCSVGIFMTGRRRSYSHYYKMADQALYTAKRAGKNQYYVIWEM